MNLAEMKAALAALLKQSTAIYGAAKEDGGRDLTDEEGAKVDAILEETESIQGDIDKIEASQNRQNRVAALEAKINKPGVRKTAPEASSPIQEPIEAGADTVTPGLKVLGQASRHDEEMCGFANNTDFLSSVVRAGSGRGVDPRLEPLAAIDGMNQATGSDGGFLVVPSFSKEIWDGMNTAADNLISMTTQFDLGGAESFTFPANAETSKATGSRFGGVQGFWIEEGEVITESNPTLRQVKLEPHELAVLVPVTDKLLRNGGPAVSQYVSLSATEEINFLVGDAFLNGDGVGKPMGILNSGSTVEVAKESSQTALTVNAANINKMWSRMHAKRRAGAVWFINQDVEPQLLGLQSDTSNGIPVFLPAGMMVNQPLAMLLGRPIIPLDYANTVGSVGDIIFADMKGYATARQGGINEAMSIHLKFDSAQTVFRFMFEIDGQTILDSPITPFKGTKTLSSFVTLAVRS